jgi:ubiquinone/menaquinone biosynthesis C-methylase UbiE
MRVVDLDRDMRDVIPTGTSRDSEFLFRRMTDRTLGLAGAASGRRILDVASGFGQDARALAAEGALVVAAEPSARMSALARMQDAESAGPHCLHLRAWADVLPFADASFDAVICKGAIDHFDAPLAAVAEMARVTRSDGQVVLAIANFDSLSCRVARSADALRESWRRQTLPRGRRHYDVPHDHFTRYELALMREQAEAHLRLEVVEGISLAWGLPRWTRAVQRLPEAVAQAALTAFDRLAGVFPALADVVVLAGRPRRSATTSA